MKVSSKNLLCLAVALLLGAGIAPSAARASGNDDACGVVGSPCTLADISAQALADSGAANVVRAGYSLETLSDGTEVTLYVVRVRFADGTEDTLYYNTADCTRVLPPVPTVSFLDALALAVALSQTVAPGPAQPIVLSGKLVNELLEPTYLFQLVDPQGGLMTVGVDALTGEAAVVPQSGKRGSKDERKGKGRRKGFFNCDDSSSDADSDDADSDVDESDSDSEDAGSSSGVSFGRHSH